MRILFVFSLFISLQAFAKPPECPLHSNKSLCLQSVEENYKSFFDFLKDEDKENKDELIRAANDIKKFESLACHKTCLN